jgi:NAD-dependent dihydropyrimidine dehydrogenase PreA subunit
MQHKYLKNVVTLELNKEKCIGCGMCLEVCPHHVFQMDSKKAQIQNRDGCMECGACSRNCPVGAITVRAGVGCAYAIVKGKLTGTEPSCDCGCGESSGDDNSCCS